MAFSKTQLISNALILLGDEPISSLNSEEAGAVAGANLYESSYLAMLSSHRWNFATKKADLARLSEAPKNEYLYQYQLPTDLVLLITTQPASTYRIIGDKLQTDSTTVAIDYIYRVPEDQFPAYFIKAFEYYLARDLCIPVTEDMNKMEVMQRMYEMESRRARYCDSQSEPQTAIQDTPYTVIRHF